MSHRHSATRLESKRPIDAVQSFSPLWRLSPRRAIRIIAALALIGVVATLRANAELNIS